MIFREFELRVAQIYRDLGAKVEHDKNLDGMQIDIFVLFEAPDGSIIREAIECKSYTKPLGINEVIHTCERLDKLKKSGKIDKGVIVTLNGFTQDARTQCEASGIERFTISDLERHIWDCTSYLYEIRDHYLDMEVAKKNLFIDTSARSERGKKIESLSEYLYSWIEGPGQLLTILGEYGSGKTTACWNLAFEYAQQYLTYSSLSNRVPLIIELKHLGMNFNLRGFLNEYFLDQKGTKIKSYSTFEKLNREGKFIIILDGFDELSFKSDFELLKRHFNDIKSLAEKKAKIILTCRTSFFKDNTDIEKLYVGTELYESLHQHKTYQVIFLEGFSEEQISEYIYKYYGDEWLTILEAFENREDLKSLASRPILLNLMAKSIRNSESINNLNTTSLYRKATQAWIERDDWRCKLSTTQRSLVSKTLAFMAVSEHRESIHHEELQRIISDQFSSRLISQEMLDLYSLEVRTCSFLKNDLHGFYTFVHKSFSEFLAADFMLDNLLSGRIEILATEVSIETLDFLVGLIRISNDNLLPIILRSFQTQDLNFSNITINRIKATGLFLLHQCGYKLDGLNISDSTFPSKLSFNGIDAPAILFERISGNQLSFDRANLSLANFSNSNLTKCSFCNSKLIETCFDHTDLTKSIFFGSDLSSASFVHSKLEKIIITPSDTRSHLHLEYLDTISKSVLQLKLAFKLSQKDKNIESSLRKEKKRDIALTIARKIRKETAFETLFSSLSKFLIDPVDDRLIDTLIQKNDLAEKYISSIFKEEQNKLNSVLEKIESKLVPTLDNLHNDSRVIIERKKYDSDKRQIRKDKRILQFNFGLIKRRFNILRQILNQYATSLHALNNSIQDRNTKVTNANFYDAIGLTDEQSEWLSRNGANLRRNKN